MVGYFVLILYHYNNNSNGVYSYLSIGIAGKYDVSINTYRDQLNLQVINGMKLNTSLYQDRRACDELLQSIGTVLQEDMRKNLQEADFIAVLADESTDQSSCKKNLSYVYWVKDCVVQRAVLEVTDLKGDGTAAAIYKAVADALFDTYGVDKSKVAVFVSDGCSTMVAENGVGRQFAKQANPFILMMHCVAHRLQLAVQDVAEKSNHVGVKSFVEYFEGTLKSIYNHFAHSAKRYVGVPHYPVVLHYNLI